MTDLASTPFSADTLSLFANLLSMVQLQAGADDFETLAGQVIVAKRELATAIAGFKSSAV